VAVPLYFDHDSEDVAVISALRLAGLDVLTSSDVGNERAPDDQQLKYASENGRLIYTANTRDYARLHRDLLARGGSHAGIAARVRQATPIGAQIAGLLHICTQLPEEQVRNQMFYI
jgi:hypothetical protein